jgi:hypothetical protein
MSMQSMGLKEMKNSASVNNVSYCKERLKLVLSRT